MDQHLILDHDRRTRCPVCGNRITYVWGLPGEDVTGLPVPCHSEGLLGSGRRCYTSGLLGWEAQQMGADVGREPSLPLRAHP